MHDGLNPALAATRRCPHCGREPEIDHPRSLHCHHCGHRQYFNPKPVACAIPLTHDGRIVLMRRGPGPEEGRWTFPGGFVDLGESAEQAAIREVDEELRLPIALTGLLGVYSRPDDRVLLVVYVARALGEPQTTVEAPEVAAFAPADVPWDGLAFWSTREALEDLLQQAAAHGLRDGGGPV